MKSSRLIISYDAFTGYAEVHCSIFNSKVTSLDLDKCKQMKNGAKIMFKIKIAATPRTLPMYPRSAVEKL